MSPDRSELEPLLRELRAQGTAAPPFARVWRGAQARLEARRSRRWVVRAAVTLPAATLLVALLVLAPGSREPVPEASAEELARRLSSWQTPLDFLLEPPGGDLFGYRAQPLGRALTLEPDAFEIEEIL